MKSKAIIKLILISVIFFISKSDFYSQIEFYQPRYTFEFSSGFDDNPLSMSNVSDSIKINSFVEQIGGRISSKITWNENIKSVLSLSGDYSLFPKNNRFNDWRTDFSFETSTKLYPKYKKSWIPGVYWNLGIDVGAIDQLFTDRVLGDEFESSLSQGEILKMGDLLDRFTQDYFTSFRFKFSNNVNFYFQWLIANNNYTDLGSQVDNSFLSLDNSENMFSGKIEVYILNNLNVTLNYSTKKRIYDYKNAKQLDKTELFRKKREYLYTSYEIKTNIKLNNIDLSLGYSIRGRDDRFEGYYNYDYSSAKAKLKYRFSQNISLLFAISIAEKEYSNLTLSKTLLSNDYQIYSISIPYKLYKDLSIAPKYIFDKEKSTYYKFSYKRNFFSFNIKYKL